MTTTEVFLTRSPLLGRDGKFAAYAFHASAPSGTTAYEPALLQHHVAARPLFVDGAPDDLPATLGTESTRTVIARLDAHRDTERIAPLRQKGFGICVQFGSTQLPSSPALGAGDYVWWQPSAQTDLTALAKATERLPGKRIAAAIDTRGAHQEARALGADLLTGSWYLLIQPTGRAVAPTQKTLMELLNLVQTEAPASKIEPVLKRDAALSFRLLRYINSSGFGLQCEITSFRHAVSILGYRNLARWLSLLMATAGTGATAPALMREAAVRGRLAELIGHGLVPPEEHDTLFIIGVFSLLPAILQLPMDQLLDQLHLAEPVTDALLTRQGLFGPILKLAEAVESNDIRTLGRLTADLQLSAAQLNHHHLAAVEWADRLTL